MGGAAFFISQAISVVTAITAVMSKQFKSMKLILITEILTTLMVAVSYILLDGGKSGFIVSIIATVQALIMFGYDRKGKRSPIAIAIVFAVAYLFFSLYNNTDVFINYFPALAAVCFSFAIMMNKSKNYRIFIFCNASLWLIYDFCIISGNILVHIGVAVSALIGLIRVDGLFGLVKQKKIGPENAEQ